MPFSNLLLVDQQSWQSLLLDALAQFLTSACPAPLCVVIFTSKVSLCIRKSISGHTRGLPFTQLLLRRLFPNQSHSEAWEVKSSAHHFRGTQSTGSSLVWLMAGVVTHSARERKMRVLKSGTDRGSSPQRGCLCACP